MMQKLWNCSIIKDPVEMNPGNTCVPIRHSWGISRLYNGPRRNTVLGMNMFVLVLPREDI
jgi:hypothetical protein